MTQIWPWKFSFIFIYREDTFSTQMLNTVIEQLMSEVCQFCYHFFEKSKSPVSQAVSSLSYQEFIECRDIGLFRISKSISYRTSHIEYLDMPSICLYFVFFRRKFSEKSENSLEIPKILRKFRKFSENSENSQKFLKIRRKF